MSINELTKGRALVLLKIYAPLSHQRVDDRWSKRHNKVPGQPVLPRVVDDHSNDDVREELRGVDKCYRDLLKILSCLLPLRNGGLP